MEVFLAAEAQASPPCLQACVPREGAFAAREPQVAPAETAGSAAMASAAARRAVPKAPSPAGLVPEAPKESVTAPAVRLPGGPQSAAVR